MFTQILINLPSCKLPPHPVPFQQNDYKFDHLLCEYLESEIRIHSGKEIYMILYTLSIILPLDGGIRNLYLSLIHISEPTRPY